MTGDEMRDQLAAALAANARLEVKQLRTIDALLPVVRKIAADELRAAADAMRDRATRLTFEAKVHMQHEARLLDRRADALDPQ